MGREMSTDRIVQRSGWRVDRLERCVDRGELIGEVETDPAVTGPDRATAHPHHVAGRAQFIEVGAAMALYGRKVILLVEKGVTLPSNLQGLYRCHYEGDRLDYDSTMKLLKTFSQFR